MELRKLPLPPPELLIREGTATVYIFHRGRVLLHFHPKLQKWLPPGGHLEPNETPSEAALREVKEETGLEISLLSEDRVTLDASHAVSLPRPFLVLLENIPPYKDRPAHQHVDSIYLATLKESEGALPECPGFRWFSYEELPKVQGELFSDTELLLSKARELGLL